jgi:phospholipid/cholesterol/gamma-HCH transport system ATP-binding protein
MIEVSNVHKSFGAQQVLRGVDLFVESGRNLIILGRSGTGKSVLLKLIVGLIAADKGKINVLNSEITSTSRAELHNIRKQIGYLFQDGALYDSMTLLENVSFPIERHTRLSAAEIRDIALAKLAQVELEEFAHKLPGEISGGMRKRAGLARALAIDPRIMLYDEPTAGLDPITAREIDELISEIDELIVRLKKDSGVTSITVTHEIVSARNIGDEFAVLHEGRVIERGSFEQLQESDNNFVRRFLANAFTSVG